MLETSEGLLLDEGNVAKTLETDALAAAWYVAASYLCTHELIGQVAGLSTAHLALLGDERCWTTVALPCGAKRLELMFRLMLLEERELWAKPLRQVRILDLDLHRSGRKATELLQQLLMRTLPLESVLERLHVRRLPVLPIKDGDGSAPKLYNKKDMKLVNPLPEHVTVDVQPVFLLQHDVLKRFRLLMSGFSTFRIGPSVSRCIDSAVDLCAERGTGNVMALLEIVKDGAHSSSEEVLAQNLLDVELGALRNSWAGLCSAITTSRVSTSAHSVRGNSNQWIDYDSWVGALLPTYQMLIANCK